MIAELVIAAILGQPFDAESIGNRFGHADAARCQTCHPRHYAEWQNSLHAASVDRLIGPAGSRWHPSGAAKRLDDPVCQPCHGGDGLQALFERDALSPAARLGHGSERTTSCVVCHAVGEVPAAAAALAAGAAAPATAIDPRAVEKSTAGYRFHADAKPLADLRQRDFCGPCHEVVAPNGLALERSWSQYLASPYPARGETCVTCHMLTYGGAMTPGGYQRGTLHRHDFIGADTAVHAVPAVGPQGERIRRFLEAAATMFVRSPERAVSGRAVTIEVEVVNAGAGHNFPAGLAGERRAWLEVEAALDDGTRIFASGHAERLEDDDDEDDGGDDDDDAQRTVFTDRFLDAGGRVVPFWFQAARVEERSLRALERRAARFEIAVPQGLAGRSLRVSARLCFQACSPRQLRALGLEALIDATPIIDVQRHESAPIPILAREFPEAAAVVPDEVADIELALARAPAGGLVIVRAGEYALSRPLTFPPWPVTLLAVDGAERTVLRRVHGAATAPAERGSVVVFEDERGGASRIEGFTITGGRGTEHEGSNAGGGIFVRGASPRIAGCRVRDNEAAGDGGGIALIDSDATISDCEIAGNRAGANGGGVAVSGASRVVIERGRIERNAAGERGGGLNAAAVVSVRATRIAGNQAANGGGGAAFESRSLADLQELVASEILGNAAPVGGGILTSDSSPRIEATVIAGNAARIGGGVYVVGAVAPELVHVTMTENTASTWGAIRFREDGAAPRVRGSIVFDNRPADLAGDFAGSLVDELGAATEAAGNIAGFPLFERPGRWEPCAAIDEPGCVPTRWASGRPPVPAAYGRWVPGLYGLVVGSPAIDAGDADGPPDADGTRRDLGAIPRMQPQRGFVRGDLDADGGVDLLDALPLFGALLGVTPLPCADVADVDDRDGVGPADLLALLLYGFGAPIAPAAPWPGCGIDPTPDDGVGCFETQMGCR